MKHTPPHFPVKIAPPKSLKTGTLKEHQDWDYKMAEEHPHWTWVINHYRNIVLSLSNAKWKLLHRFHPDHKYNTVVVGEPGYYEPHDVMLLAPFVVFERFMKSIYKNGTRKDWDMSDAENQMNTNQSNIQAVVDGHKHLWTEMEALYKWWTDIRPHRETVMEELHPIPNLPDDFPIDALFLPEYQDDPEVMAIVAAGNARENLNRQWEDEDHDMVCRLMKIRTKLWD